MDGYLIKATYITGPHAGKSYLLRKGGYVTDETQGQWADTVYKTEAICKRRCEKMTVESDTEYYIETTSRANRRMAGKEVSRYRIHEKMIYEPYLVTDVHPTNI